MIWWRIELDRSGAILKCTQVESVEENKRLVCYVQATTKVEACSEAKAWIAERTRKNKERHARRRSEGRCHACESFAIPGTPSCQAHGPQPKSLRELRARQEAAQDARFRNILLEKDEARRWLDKQALSVELCAVLLRHLRAWGFEGHQKWLVSEIERRSSGAPASVGQTAGDGVQLPT